MPVDHNSAFDLNLLPALKVLLAEKHITRAAERLGITQSALSKMLDKMRRSFNDPLLIRKNNSYTLSPVACRLQQALERVMPSINSILNHKHFDAKTSSRVFNITATDFGAFILVPHLVEKMIDYSSRIQISPWNEQIFDRLSSGTVDIALWPFPAPEEFHSQFLIRCGLKCLVSKNHFPGNSHLTLEDYIAHQHVQVVRSDKFESMVDMLLSTRGYCRSIKAFVPYFTTAAYIASSTACIATVPSLMAEALSVVTNTRIVDPPEELPQIDYLQIWHPRMEDDDGHIWLRDQVAEIARRVSSATH